MLTASITNDTFILMCVFMDIIVLNEHRDVPSLKGSNRTATRMDKILTKTAHL